MMGDTFIKKLYVRNRAILLYAKQNLMKQERKRRNNDLRFCYIYAVETIMFYGFFFLFGNLSVFSVVVV